MSLDRESQRERLKKVIALAGPRYTPELNVELPINLIFDGLGRTPSFFFRLKEAFGKIRRNYSHCRPQKALDAAPTEYSKIQDSVMRLVSFLGEVDKVRTAKIEFEDLRDDLSKATEAIWKCIHVLRAAEEASKEQPQPPGLRHPREELNSARHYLFELHSELRKLSAFCRSNEALVANNPCLLLTGVSGSGKTHLFCDIAAHRIEKDFLTFVFLGEEFDGKDPWEVIKRLLGISCSTKRFLQALDQQAAEKKTRAILMVDALNEERVHVNWGLLDVIQRHKNIAVALSVRTGFEREVFRTKQLRVFIQEEHKGFQYKEWEAVKKFFTAFNLPLPEVPILTPEFRNPAFLLLFCKGVSERVRSTKKQAFRGHEGTTYIFEQFVKNTADRIAKEFGIRPGKDKHGKYAIWDNIVEKIAEKMASKRTITDRISEKDALTIIRNAYPNIDASKLLGSLEKNHLLTRVAKYSKNFQPRGYAYRFPFQKFSDHLIVRFLLNSHLKDPAKSFRSNTKLGKLLESYWNRGLVEALAIQVPERLKGKDLVFLTSRKFRESDLAQETFIESLIWRDPSLKDGKPKSFDPKAALKYINEYIIQTKAGNDRLLEAFLTVSTVPGHPFNARLLHSYLMRFKLAKRDTWWLPFLHSNYTEDGVINRLITWAWEGGDKSHIRGESLELAATTLAWFLASSNRFLRDRATKALVALLTDRSDVLIKLLHSLQNVNDPYVAERLYAVAYGSALRSQSQEDLSTLARHVYDLVFRAGKAPVHILLRDYARGVIEAALHKGIKLNIDATKIRPPYKSRWPRKIMSQEQVKKYDRREYGLIWHSLLYSNGAAIADFGNYVVHSSLNHWTCFVLGKPRPLTPSEIYASFLEELAPEQRKLWDKRSSAKASIIMQAIQGRQFSKEELGEIEEEEHESERAFYDSLSEKQRQIYIKDIRPHGTHSTRPDMPYSDYAALERWIFQRVLQLGWKPELFKSFDSSLDTAGRDTRKSERVGKKYQWIGFHELLARIADNFEFRKDPWSGSTGKYEGPWQLLRRDIDPSCLLKREGKEENSGKRPWWFRFQYDAWKKGLTDTEWLKTSEDIPDPQKLIEVTDNKGNTWLVLEGSFRWMEPHPPEENRYEKPRRDLWLIVKSYLVQKCDLEKVFSWATEQDLFGRWMPESHDFIDIFLREYPWAASFESRDSPRDNWIQHERIPGKVLVSDEKYLQEQGYDCSIETSIHIKLPAKWLYNKMGLRASRVEGAYADRNGQIAVFDPSLYESGPGALLMDKQKLIEFSSSESCGVVWTILGEKLVMSNLGTRYWPGRLEISGAYRLDDEGKLVGRIHSKFTPPSS